MKPVRLMRAAFKLAAWGFLGIASLVMGAYLADTGIGGVIVGVLICCSLLVALDI